MLVVHHRHRRDPRRTRAATTCAYEPCESATSGLRVTRESAECRCPAGDRRRLADAARRARAADDLDVGPDVARARADVCAWSRAVRTTSSPSLRAGVDDRLEERHVRRVGEVDPDAHHAGRRGMDQLEPGEGAERRRGRPAHERHAARPEPASLEGDMSRRVRASARRGSAAQRSAHADRRRRARRRPRARSRSPARSCAHRPEALGQRSTSAFRPRGRAPAPRSRGPARAAA